MLMEGEIYDGWRLERMDRNVLIWQNVESERYGVYLYENPPREYDEEFLLYNNRKNFIDAENLFFSVRSLFS